MQSTSRGRYIPVAWYRAPSNSPTSLACSGRFSGVGTGVVGSIHGDHLINSRTVSLVTLASQAGPVTSLQAGYQFTASIPVYFAAGVIVQSIILELGPVLTGLLVTGRAGSAIAAEIGTMVATEQLDGLRMMSIDPIDFVAAPKALALTLVMPLLSALFIVCGIFGGYLVGVQFLGRHEVSFRNERYRAFLGQGSWDRLAGERPAFVSPA